MGEWDGRGKGPGLEHVLFGRKGAEHPGREGMGRKHRPVDWSAYLRGDSAPGLKESV